MKRPILLAPCTRLLAVATVTVGTTTTFQTWEPSARVAGNPVKLVSHHTWQEGPCLLHRDGNYLLTYSTGAWTNDTYTVRWAKGPSALGPFTEQPEIIMASTDRTKGPGHHNFFTGPDEKTWIVYHGWDPDFKARRPFIGPLVIDENGLACRIE
jgi:beta-xylosidase